MDVPSARFFKGSPVLEVMDFLERLAPFSDPNMLVRDKQPQMTASLKTPVSEQGVQTTGTPSELDSSEAMESPESGATGSDQAFDAYKALRESLGR